ncbi:hypothetical protein Pmani_025556 [Petrolisthes manimaculis]|uniref:Uncharacterized protein n=1 Tax=Petrolisthes manimaculis TaxID=1843537 RepID=A0AAE1P7P2_9EUCA|nr:hypothetical protein Pmani_025556 [Petrolisthes manimaculis]
MIHACRRNSHHHYHHQQEEQEEVEVGGRRWEEVGEEGCGWEEVGEEGCGWQEVGEKVGDEVVVEGGGDGEGGSMELEHGAILAPWVGVGGRG